jgi:hypothetical protein
MTSIRHSNNYSQVSLVEMASHQLEIANKQELRQLKHMLNAFKDLFQSIGFNPDDLKNKTMSRLPGPGCCSPPPMHELEGNIGIKIPTPGKIMSPETFQKAPHVNTESDWAAFSNVIDSRITGSQTNREAIHCNGKNPWSAPGDVEERAAVGWVMQQNENLKYDADSKQFYQTFPDGSRRDVASLDEIRNVIRGNGGANQNNGSAFNAVGSFINDRVASLPAKVQNGGIFEANIPFSIQDKRMFDWFSHGKNKLLGCSSKTSMDVSAKISGSFDYSSNPTTLKSYPKVPLVNTESDWAAYSKAIDSRLIGSGANRQAIHLGGKNIWTEPGGNLEERAAVGWALQQNESLRYDADSKKFFTTSSDGKRQDVASLEDVTKVIRENGGANQNNSKAMQAVSSFLNQAVQKTAQFQTHPEISYGSSQFVMQIQSEITVALIQNRSMGRRY